jgi:hypothetical protein
MKKEEKPEKPYIRHPPKIPIEHVKVIAQTLDSRQLYLADVPIPVDQQIPHKQKRKQQPYHIYLQINKNSTGFALTENLKTRRLSIVWKHGTHSHYIRLSEEDIINLTAAFLVSYYIRYRYHQKVHKNATLTCHRIPKEIREKAKQIFAERRKHKLNILTRKIRRQIERGAGA